MYYSNSDVRTEELTKPEIGPNEILVKVKASGICGSDLMEWYRVKTAPRVLGHEIAGQITEAGADVKDFKVRDRVFVSHHVPCDTCDHCQKGNHTVCEQLRTTNFDPGGFAEYVRVPEVNMKNGVFILPDNMSYPAGTFIEPLGCVVRGQRTAGDPKGKTILIIGSGISGMLHLLLARAKGAEKVFATDVSDFRLKMAKDLGAFATFHASQDIPKKVKTWNKGKLADMVIVCAGAPSAMKQALASVEKGGTILFFAPTKPDVITEVEIWELWKNCISLATSYAAAPEDIKEAIQLLETKEVDIRQLITHKLSLDETAKGFKLMVEAKDSLKIIIEPHK